ncbi:MAG: DUF1592 domain-containing protein [Planctomycetota bacterium]|nr:DUF1592 domain-containing protein [Planctomycetota bacterium]
MTHFRRVWCGVSLLSILVGFVAVVRSADDAPSHAELAKRWTDDIRPFVERHCVTCHGEQKPAAQLRLDQFESLDSLARQPQTWLTVLERVESGEMPPEDAKRQPSDEERGRVVRWIRDWRKFESERNAGDPGPVPARRLSNAELDHTIRDLTGFPLRPSHEFPVDPANEAGFDNSGESLSMSPALFRKYVAAMREVADHAVLAPDGLRFAPHPVATDTDRDKYCVHRIVEFYRRHKVDTRDYLLAAWRFRHRDKLGQPEMTLEAIATEEGLSQRYLSTLWKELNDTEPTVGPLAAVRSLWNGFPVPDGTSSEPPQSAANAVRDLIVAWRSELKVDVPRLSVKGISDGTQPFVLWRNQQLANRHRSYEGVPANDLEKLRSKLPADHAELSAFLKLEPDDEPVQATHLVGLRRFCDLFPLAFFVDDRGPYFDPKGAGQGRLLTAGFHLMQGYFRDDAPLYDLVLDDTGRAELDALWNELEFIADVLQRQYQDYIFFERAEPPQFMGEAIFDFARSEDKDCSSEAKMRRLADVYLEKVRKRTDNATAIEAIAKYYESMSQRIHRVEQARRDAEPVQLRSLVEFASRAWRRPLTPEEQEGLLGFYRQARLAEGLSHEDAVRDTLTTVLLAPQFCYRFDLAADGSEPRPLSDLELASRLSYFLWASMPDAELLAVASRGELRESAGLLLQTRKLLRDPKVRGLATEFGGNWLDFRRFEEHNAVDRERFPMFTNELRQAMFEEPVRFFVDLAQHDRSVLEFLYGRHTFVNGPLAAHYGIPFAGPRDDWKLVDNAREFGRGGLLPMGVFLTQNAPGLRTSPVKRGYWVVRRLLGEQIPPPPPTVPELPRDEKTTGDLSIPQLLAKHRDNRACAGCHQRFDAVGVVFEGFGPVGERRSLDLAGRPVAQVVEFPDGTVRDGVDGLRTYLADRRQDDFRDSLSRKLLAYALGRSLLLSDEPLLETMRAEANANGNTLRSLIETIVLSPQFRNKRGASLRD